MWRKVIGFGILLCSLGISFIPVAYAQTCEAQAASDFFQSATVAGDENRWRDVISLMDCAIAQVTDNPDYYNQRGIGYFRLLEDDLALADFEKALTLDSDYEPAFNNIANIYYAQGNYEQAIDYYQRGIADNANPEIPYTNLASLFYELGDYEQSLVNANLAVEANDAYANVYLNRAYAYMGLGRTAESNADFLNWILLIEKDRTASTLIANSSYEVTLYDGKVFAFEFTAEAGTVLSVEVASADSDQFVDPLVVILDSNGTPIAADDDSGLNLDAVVNDITLTTSGAYTILVSHAAGYLYSGTSGNIDITTTLINTIGTTVAAEPSANDSTNTIIPTTVPNSDIGNDIPTFQTFALVNGELAQIYTTEGDRLNLRSGPGLRFDIVEKLDKWTQVTLVEGPRKADGYAWWFIRTADGIEGWAVERVEDEQTLQLALVMGEDAIITSGDELLNVRANAGTGNELLFQLSNDTLVVLVEGPVEADGFSWWRIRTSDGREGWIVDRINGERMIIPAKERG